MQPTQDSPGRYPIIQVIFDAVSDTTPAICGTGLQFTKLGFENLVTEVPEVRGPLYELGELLPRVPLLGR